MKKKGLGSEIMKKIGYWIIIIIFLGATLFAAVRGATDIPPGECNLFNYTSYDNMTNSTLFTSQEFCCQEQAINYTENVYVNISLSPGEQLISGVQNCNYNAQCSSFQINSPVVCSRSRNLHTGETYRLDDGICDLHFECIEKEPETCEDFIQTNVVIQVKKINDTLFVNSLDQEKSYGINVTTFSDDFTVQVQCPELGGSANYTSNIQWLSENCANYIDQFDSKNIIAWQLMMDYLEVHDERSYNFAMTILQNTSTLQEQLRTAEVRVEELRSVEFRFNQLQSDFNDLRVENKSLKGDKGVLIGSIIILCLIMVFMLYAAIDNGMFEVMGRFE